MKLLHTSDWHVGKSIRGHSRADEHRQVLTEIAAIAAEEAADVIVVAGDLYETAAPSAESETIVNEALLRLAEIAPVIAVAGNHDNPRRLAAISPLLRLGRITMATAPQGPADGGRVQFNVDDIVVDVALLPFVSQRGMVRVDQLMDNAAYENAQTYANRMRRVLHALCADFQAENVNLIVGHLFVHGGDAGGGERQAHLTEEYGISAVDIPPTAQYAALGHLHRPQQMLGSTAIHYCGSPLQLDFGESQQTKQVNLVDLEPGLPAKMQARVLKAGKPLRTVRGSLADVAAQAESLDDEDRENTWFRVRLLEASRSGLADDARQLLGSGVVDVRVEREEAAIVRPSRSDRTPHELFADYLSHRGVNDPAVEKRFLDLYDEFLEERP